jgi:putative hydrolase of the HAD superfamily
MTEAHPDWAAIDHVILDMDGTLLDLHFDNQVWNELLPRRYAEAHGLTPSAARARVDGLLASARGSLRWYCLDHWNRMLGLDMDALEVELADLIGLRPGALAFLEWLGQRAAPPVLATNAHPRSLARKLARTAIAPHFAAIVSAHELGEPKESPGFWQALAARQPFTPARTLLVDDNPAVLSAASAWGIAHTFGIARPDSRGACGPTAGFPCVADFARFTGAAAQPMPSRANASS